jgi:hypothetical protein
MSIAGGAVAGDGTILMGGPEDLTMSVIVAADSVTRSAKTGKRLGIDVAGVQLPALLVNHS